MTPIKVAEPVGSAQAGPRRAPPGSVETVVSFFTENGLGSASAEVPATVAIIQV